MTEFREEEKKVSALQEIEPGLSDPQTAMYTIIPQSLADRSKGEIRTDCNFCQISLLSKVRKTSLRLGTSKISFLIVTNSSFPFEISSVIAKISNCF